MSEPSSSHDADDEVLTGELLDGDANDDQEPPPDDADSPEPREEIDQPTRLLRIAGMVKGLLTEVETTELDEAARERLGRIHSRSVGMLREIMSDDLAAELDDLSLDFARDDVPTAAELQVAQAQLAGWLEGLFHGIQASMATRQLTSRQRGQLQEAVQKAQGDGSSTGQYL